MGFLFVLLVFLLYFSFLGLFSMAFLFAWRDFGRRFPFWPMSICFLPLLRAGFPVSIAILLDFASIYGRFCQ